MKKYFLGKNKVKWLNKKRKKPKRNRESKNEEKKMENTNELVCAEEKKKMNEICIQRILGEKNHEKRTNE